MTASPPSERCRIRRKPTRAHYDRETLYAIIDAAHLCHVAFAEGASVHCLPLACWRDGDDLYIHAAVNSRLAQALPGGEAAVAITHLDGLVLARSAMHHSMNYRSACIYGRFVPVEGEEAKRRALAAFLEHVCPGRNALVRPPSPAELAGTTVLRLPLAEAAAKIRDRGVDDLPEDLARPVWAGVIPLRQQAEAGLPEAGCTGGGPFAGRGKAAAAGELCGLTPAPRRSA